MFFYPLDFPPAFRSKNVYESLKVCLRHRAIRYNHINKPGWKIVGSNVPQEKREWGE